MNVYFLGSLFVIISQLVKRLLPNSKFQSELCTSTNYVNTQSIFSPKPKCRGHTKIAQSIRKRKQMLNAFATLAFVVTFKFQVFQVFIYLQHTLKLLLGWLANSKELTVASQTVHTVE